jgi:tricorn protease
MTRSSRFVLLAVLVSLIAPTSVRAASPMGYYRQPSLHGSTLVFIAEGDVWKVPDTGGVAARLTSHPGNEATPAISPDGKTLAFVASYEGPTEVYTMPLAGGLPTRRTYGSGNNIAVVGWTPDGRVLAATDVYSTIPNRQLVALDVARADAAGIPTRLPLFQAADGDYTPDGKTLFFTRFAFQGSHTKRYKGGTAQSIWKFADGDAEATCLTKDYLGTSRRPMVWSGRVYFVSDRDGSMNLWSMLPDGGDLRQHTRHAGWDAQGAALDGGRIVYQLGADIHLYDIAAAADRIVPIAIDSDLDQLREHWIDKPMDYLTAAHVAPDGERVALTARGEVFVAPLEQGRFVQVTRKEGVRYRNARFMPDGKTLLALSDESGEVELWRLPANGVGPGEQLTSDAATLRWDGIPSPDGKRVAHWDKRQRLFLFDLATKRNVLVEANEVDQISDVTWSPDSRWIAYVARAENYFRRIKVYNVGDGSITPVTSDRFDSYSPAWSADGKWLYFISDRNLVSIVQGAWGNNQPEPYLDKTSQIFELALTKGLRSPFTPDDELQAAEAPAEDTKEKKDAKKDEEASAGPAEVRIDKEGIEQRLALTPIPAGNYGSLVAIDKALFWLSAPTGGTKADLAGAEITNQDLEVKTVVEGVESFEATPDGKKLLVRKGETFYVIDAAAKPAELEKNDVDLSAWALSVIPREEWRQMFIEAWRLERDYFYDPDMHGVDWKSMRAKYEPLVDRVTNRAELSDVLAQLVSELSALHIFVYGGEFRSGKDAVELSTLGAVLRRDERAGGYRVEHVYRSDPDEPGRAGPLARPGVNVTDGDLITMVNGVPALDAADIGALLRRQAGRQVLLRVQASSGGDARDVIVEPMTTRQESDLRYHEWEYTRRLEVDRLSNGRIGYVHLRAMGAGNYTEWAKGFYPEYTKEGLIVDVRRNNGGNIDSWILSRLMRKAWMFWSQPVGKSPTWNMQCAFRGHVAALCDEKTSSDGEVFAEGVRRLGIGTVIGTRTWGGEIWLSSDNFLVDGGIATAAEYGVFGPEGEWLIEGHGVDPDIVVDNLPHATFGGEDAQLKAAVDHLLRKMAEEPVLPPPQPAFPDKSFK